MEQAITLNETMFYKPVAEYSITEIRNAKNPYTLEDTVIRLRRYLRLTGRADALSLLEKAVEKAKRDRQYYLRFEDTFLHGSTIAYRELLADFGDYFARTSDTIPYYPHHDAVNGIDTAMHHIRIGHEQQAIAEYNALHGNTD